MVQFSTGILNHQKPIYKLHFFAQFQTPVLLFSNALYPVISNL